MGIRYKILKMRARARRLFESLSFNPENTTDTQILAYNIVKRAILRKDADLLIAPLSNVYYINLPSLNVKILDNHVQIINGKYFYDIHLNEKLMTDLNRIFNRRVESRKHLVDNRIVSNTNRSLINIYNDIHNETTSSSSNNQF